jgi:hypothetical protein
MDKLNQKALVEKWGKVLDSEKMPAIDGANKDHRKYVTAQLIENTLRESKQQAEYDPMSMLTEDTTGTAPSNDTGSSFQKYDPILVSLIRRAMPNLIAYDVCGVQPMTGPTGLIFALRPKYNADPNTGVSGQDAFYYEANTAFSSNQLPSPGENDHLPAPGQPGEFSLDPQASPLLPAIENAGYQTGKAMSTAEAEALGSTDGVSFNEMGITMDKVTVTAGSRALRADYSVELAQDMKNIHGLDVESELSNILVSEILAEINREVIRTIYTQAKIGCQQPDVTAAGKFDVSLDSNGRWAAERFKGMLYQVEREANTIAKETRRGKGNVVICSADVAAAFAMAGVLDYTKVTAELQVDDTGNTFAGILNGKYKVYIDPYAPAGVDFCVVGYKGANQYDSGVFYCPYVPLQMFKTVGQDSFQPRIGFKTRYGVVANPFARGVDLPDPNGNLAVSQADNVYYRRFLVTSLMDAAAGVSA